MFNASAFKKYLKTQWLGHELCYHEKLNSTNSYLKRLDTEEISHGMLCLTDHQLRGRGQYDRHWESESGANLTFSLVFTPVQNQRLHVLTLALAETLVEMLQRQYQLQAAIKWPNDILINGKKVAGLLTETAFSGNHLDRVLVGVGLNLNQTSFSDVVAETATSIKKELGFEVEREQFLADFLLDAEQSYAHWSKRSRELITAINFHLLGYGKWVSLQVNGDKILEKQKLLGINEQGKLIVIDKNADVKAFAYEQIRILVD